MLHEKGYDIYEPSEQLSEDGLRYYVFIVGKNCIPTKENVWEETKHMAESWFYIVEHVLVMMAGKHK